MDKQTESYYGQWPKKRKLWTVRYPYNTDISAISVLIRDYIDTPNAELLAKDFANDHWGLVRYIESSGQKNWWSSARRIEKENGEQSGSKTHWITTLNFELILRSIIHNTAVKVKPYRDDN